MKFYLWDCFIDYGHSWDSQLKSKRSSHFEAGELRFSDANNINLLWTGFFEIDTVDSTASRLQRRFGTVLRFREKNRSWGSRDSISSNLGEQKPERQHTRSFLMIFNDYRLLRHWLMRRHYYPMTEVYLFYIDRQCPADCTYSVGPTGCPLLECLLNSEFALNFWSPLFVYSRCRTLATWCLPFITYKYNI